jgi:hypothetical protein
VSATIVELHSDTDWTAIVGIVTVGVVGPAAFASGG